MRSIKTFAAGLGVLLLASGAAFAGAQNQVGAMLVFTPVVANVEVLGLSDGGGVDEVETFITITNAGQDAINVHLSYINGLDLEGDGETPDESRLCYECDASIKMSANDTDTISIRKSTGPNINGEIVTILRSVDDNDPEEELEGQLSLACDWDAGFIVATIEDDDENTLQDNVLLGELVHVNYTEGLAFSMPAISIQGGDGGDGDRAYRLDDDEYGKLPRILAADFLARDEDTTSKRFLSLFTLGFDRQFEPLTDCSVTGYDAYENPFSASIQFGCWTHFELCDISPEFCIPYLGVDSTEDDTHGWLSLNCRVDQDPHLANGFDANGGVHGTYIAIQDDGDKLEASENCADDCTTSSEVAWARVLHQSVTTGDAVTLTVEGPGGNLGF